MFKVILDDAGADGVFTDQPDAGVNWKNSRTK
jgi:glycerophosphoryl diester phosphodiesterase